MFLETCVIEAEYIHRNVKIYLSIFHIQKWSINMNGILYFYTFSEAYHGSIIDFRLGSK